MFEIIKELKWKAYEFVKCGLPWIFVGGLLLYYHDDSIMQYDYMALIVMIAMTMMAVLIGTFVRLDDITMRSSYNLMRDVRTKEDVQVYSIIKDINGDVQFLIYKNYSWVWVLGKYYKPILDKEYD